MMQRGREVLLALSLCLFFSSYLRAQAIRPVLSEYEGEAKGYFELINQGPTPLNVVLEPRSFTVDEQGELRYGPMDTTNVHLKLASMSFRIPPRQSYMVFYTATADKPPAWFVIFANITGMPRREEDGLKIQLELPHTVYVLPRKRSFTRDSVKVNNVRYNPVEKKLELQLENTGEDFGRVQQTVITGEHKRVEAGGVPLFPHRRRTYEVGWDGAEPPQKVIFQFTKFSVEADVHQE